MNIVGNTYNKYESKNPIARYLMAGFLREIDRLAQRCQPSRVLEVGCGEGYLISHLTSQLTSATEFAACDLSLARVKEGLADAVRFEIGSVYNLPYLDESFDLVLCCEVLEHLESPEKAVAELRRVTARHVLISTPNEPFFRGLNVLRFAYLRDFGNTPGHIQHFTPTKLTQLLARQLTVLELSRPLPWIVALTERQESCSAA